MRPASPTVVLEMLGVVSGTTGGAETHARQLVRLLPRLDSHARYVVAVGAEIDGVGDAAERWNGDLTWPSTAKAIRPLRTAVQSLRFARMLASTRPELVHCLAMFPKPPWGAPRMIVTVPDLNFELFPECWGLVDRLAMRTSCGVAVRRAEALITVSEFSKRALVERYGADAARVFVTPLGVDHDVYRLAQGRDRVASGRAGSRPLLLYPAHTWPHKNHVRLVEALALLRDAHGLMPELILTGAPKAGHDALSAAVARLGLEGQVLWRGHVAQSELVELYRTATLLVFPSLHEGFGLPLLEAMACGCPVVCAGTTGTAETAADAALTFDPTSVEAIAEAVRRVLVDEQLRFTLAQRGIARAARATWEATARDTIRAYDDVRARLSNKVRG